MSMENYSTSARQAREVGYGDKKYWEYLDKHALESYKYFAAKGEMETAHKQYTQSLHEAIAGNALTYSLWFVSQYEECKIHINFRPEENSILDEITNELFGNNDRDFTYKQWNMIRTMAFGKVKLIEEGEYDDSSVASVLDINLTNIAHHIGRNLIPYFPHLRIGIRDPDEV